MTTSYRIATIMFFYIMYELNAIVAFRLQRSVVSLLPITIIHFLGCGVLVQVRNYLQPGSWKSWVTNLLFWLCGTGTSR